MLQERASKLRYTYTACFVLLYLTSSNGVQPSASLATNLRTKMHAEDVVGNIALHSE